MKRAISMLGSIAVLAFAMLLIPNKAMAQVPTCTNYATGAPAYPTDGHMKVCFTPFVAQNAEQIRTAVAGLPTQVKNLLQQKNVTYFYFKNRTEANAYFNATAPYSGQPDGVFASSTARCGQTGFVFSSQTIAVAIYETCSYAGGAGIPPSTPPNPNRPRVTTHESGHAFDYSLALRANSSTPRSRKPGYRTLMDDPANGDFHLMDLMNKCTLFDSINPMGLERDLGLPGMVQSSVCSGITPNPPFGSLSNQVIARGQMPYFFNPPTSPTNTRYSELWAEQFEILASGVSGSNFLPLTDRVINLGTTCSFFNVKAYWNTLEPPGPSNPNVGYQTWPMGCPTPAESDLK